MAAAMAEQEGARNGARNRGGVQRVEGKLRASVEKGDYYEAHQMYRTLFFRYMSQGKHTEARELMYSGALLFFSHGQNSAADLSMLVLESLEKAEVDVTDELLGNLAKLFSLMDPNSPERVAFVSRALKWSGGGSGKLGHPRLHQLLALTLWKEQNYCESRYHFLHSADGEGCANMLVEYSTSRGFCSEVDMFVAQAVLQKHCLGDSISVKSSWERCSVGQEPEPAPAGAARGPASHLLLALSLWVSRLRQQVPNRVNRFLCLKNKSSASVVFTTYTQKHPSIENGPPFVQPLLNFIWFLLLAVDGGKLTVFTVLCEQYQPSLRRDPMYNEYLDRIGQLFFGVPPKQTSSYGGLLGNLLSSLMGSSEQEEGEESQEDSSPIELD
ncbi:Golgi to ER traffic protein 4 homolog isoform 2-T2 [Dugong dugon]